MAANYTTQGPTIRPWQPLIQRITSLRWVAWALSKSLHRMDGWLLRRSQGEKTFTSLLTGLPVVLLTTTGARSGQARTTPLVPILDGEKIVLIASNFGGQHHPAWYHNLRAHPQATLTLDGCPAVYLARPATESERQQYWGQAVDLYPGYAAYERRAANRRIPILVLTPVSGNDLQ